MAHNNNYPTTTGQNYAQDPPIAVGDYLWDFHQLRAHLESGMIRDFRQTAEVLLFDQDIPTFLRIRVLVMLSSVQQDLDYAESLWLYAEHNYSILWAQYVGLGDAMAENDLWTLREMLFWHREVLEEWRRTGDRATAFNPIPSPGEHHHRDVMEYHRRFIEQRASFTTPTKMTRSRSTVYDPVEPQDDLESRQYTTCQN